MPMALDRNANNRPPSGLMVAALLLFGRCVVVACWPVFSLPCGAVQDRHMLYVYKPVDWTSTNVSFAT
jgi:hypothetical protein